MSDYDLQTGADFLAGEYALIRVNANGEHEVVTIDSGPDGSDDYVVNHKDTTQSTQNRSDLIMPAPSQRAAFDETDHATARTAMDLQWQQLRARNP